MMLDLLVTSWVNGNRGWVVGELEKLTPARRAYFTLEVYLNLSGTDAVRFLQRIIHEAYDEGI